MLQWKWAAAMVLGLVLAAPAAAQQGLQTLTFGRNSPSTIVNQPIDTSLSVVPIALPQQRANVGFSLKNFLPKVGLPGAKPVHGISNFPTQQGMPGADYLRAFHYHVPQRVK